MRRQLGRAARTLRELLRIPYQGAKKKATLSSFSKNLAPTPTLRHQRRSCPKLARFIYTPWGSSDSILTTQIHDFEKLRSKQVGLVSLFENSSKFSHFCLGSFSLQSTFFSILSSLSANIRPHLAPATSNFMKKT